MEVELRFRSITWQWFLNIFAVTAIMVIVIEAVICSFFRSIYTERVRVRAAEYAQPFSVLAAVSSKDFYSTARNYVESFEHKDKIDIEIIDAKGGVFISTTGFLPDGNEMPDYDAALKSATGTASREMQTLRGEKILCGTIILTDYGAGSNGAVRWMVSMEKADRHIFILCAISIAIGVVVLLLTGISGLFFIKSIVRPIRSVSSLARKIAMGEFETTLDIKQNNEIGELCDSINYMASELRQADSVKNDFISSVSHELRTPLTAIRGWGETAKMSVGTDEEIVKKGLDVVLSESERLSSLVEELLDFSRMQNGRLTVSLVPLGISQLLSEVADMYIELANQQNIKLEYIVPREDSVILGDRDRLKQVFINIIDNAVKYTESGGQVLVEQANEDGVVRVSVKDTGVGIPAADIDRVKEKFFKSNKTIRGSGIGLAVADEIIKQHKGLLFIESAEGVGTTATVALPLFEGTEETLENVQTTGEVHSKENNN